MIKSITKTGRPTAVYKTSWGEQVPGLRRLKDGRRWRTSWPNQMTFTEPDERLAVARFREWEAGQQERKIGIPVSSARLNDMDALRKAIVASSPARDAAPAFPSYPADTPFPFALSEPSAAPSISPPRPIRMELHGDRLEFYNSLTEEDAFFPWLRRLILENRQRVSERTGIESLAYLPELSKPAPSPRLEDLVECYAAKPGLSADEVARCRRFWQEFADLVGVDTLRELTHDHVEQYEAKIGAMGLAPKSVKHRYTRIRTVIAHAMKRGKGPEDCRAALDKLAMLQVESVNSLDPNPISPAAFWKIHTAAVEAGDQTFAAMMLFSLNAALYSSEAGAVRWADVDLKRGEFAARRNKTQVPRVACLWPETVAALKALPQERGTIFNTSVQAYNRFSVHRDWTKHRAAADPKCEATFAMIRDAAFTLACRVSLDQARVLAGHRLPGATDHYILRAPQFVKDACEAIRKEFFTKTSQPPRGKGTSKRR